MFGMRRKEQSVGRLRKPEDASKSGYGKVGHLLEDPPPGSLIEGPTKESRWKSILMVGSRRLPMMKALKGRIANPMGACLENPLERAKACRGGRLPSRTMRSNSEAGSKSKEGCSRNQMWPQVTYPKYLEAHRRLMERAWRERQTTDDATDRTPKLRRTR
jgi:hypothetical protein